MLSVRAALTAVHIEAFKNLNNLKESEIVQETSEKRLRQYESELIELKDSIQETRTTMNNLFCKLTADERKNDNESMQIFEAEVDYNGTLSELNSRIRSVKRTLLDVEPSVLQTENQGNCFRDNFCSVKLAPLGLPKFSGEFTEWLSFWNRFRYAVDEVDTLPPVLKFSYLLNCLDGKAAELVKCLPFSDVSYDIAIRNLKEKFGSPDLVIRVLYNELQNLNCGTGHLGLETFSLELEKLLVQLEIFKEDTNNRTLYSMLLKKLPDWLIKEVINEEVRTNAHLLVFMLRTKIKECVRKNEMFKLATERPSKSFDLSKVSNFTFSNVAKQSNNLEKSKSCVFCFENGHFSSKCPNYTTLKSRRDRFITLKLCFGCMKKGHRFSDCKRLPSCFFCKKQHLAMFCPTKFVGNPSNENRVETVCNMAEEKTVETVNVGVKKSSSVLLKCVRAKVFNHLDLTNSAEVLVFLDEGSTASYISKSLADKLMLRPVAHAKLSFNVFNDEVTREMKAGKVEFGLMRNNGKPLIISSYAIEYLTGSMSYAFISNDSNVDSNKFSECYTEGVPDILLGCDYCYELNISKIGKSVDGFNVLSSDLGFMVAGRGNRNFTKATNSSFSVMTKSTPEDEIKDFFSLETLGITDKIDANEKIEFENFISWNNNRLETALPWKGNLLLSNNNYGKCLGRLSSVVKKLNPEMLNRYSEIISSQLQSDIIEKVDLKTYDAHPIYYLPHQPVFRSDKNKLRMVFDASAKPSKNDPALNELLEQGPLFLKNLAGILLRFRCFPVVIACDVERAFLQISVKPHDRNVLRFLWFGNPSTQENLVVYRFKRLPFGLTCSPALLATALVKFLKEKSSYANEILENLYVDNILILSSNVETAKEKCMELKKLFTSASLNLREFICNNSNVLNDLNVDDKLITDTPKVLGIKWKVESDELVMDTGLTSKPSFNKRSVLSVITSLFDPLGLLAPCTVEAKLFFQELWMLNLQWDDPLDSKLNFRWTEICQAWQVIQSKLSRFCLVPNYDLIELHVFSDASQKAYSCCAYLVSKLGDVAIKSSLVFAKARIKPKAVKKDFSIHRMELLGVLVGIRSIKYVQAELIKNFELKTKLSDHLALWTDSSTVLHWLRSQKKQDVFIENRLKEIRATKNLICRYVPTEENPADLASRGCNFSQLESSKVWWSGPSWLLGSQKFPETQIPYFQSVEKQFCEETFFVDAGKNEMIEGFRSFDKWIKLVKCMSFVLKFLSKVSVRFIDKLKIKKFLQFDCKSKQLSVKDLRIASLLLFKLAQIEAPPADGQIRDLKLSLDEFGIYRAEGRLSNTTLSFSAKYPLFLSHRSHITVLWVIYLHESFLHSGPLLTLSQSRLIAWIPSGKRSVSSIIHKHCFVCKRHKALPFQLPQTPPFPLERVCQSRPFENVGVDYCGPMKVLTKKGEQKVWVVLFTCMTVRAVHLDVVYELSAEKFMLVFRKFCARRSSPKIVYSDNAKNFVLSAKLLVEKFNKDSEEILFERSLKDFLIEKGIVWKFITERAAWCGGFYERLMSMLKHHLKRTLETKVVYSDIFEALIVELEFIINSRPITFISDSETGQRVLRPIDFILRRQLSQDPILVDHERDFTVFRDKDPTSSSNLLKIWEEDNKILNEFWTTWVQDYLLSLRERLNTVKKGVDRLPKVGETVLIHDSNLPRSHWKTASVMSLVPSKDGKIRAVKVKAGNSVLTRSIQHCFPMEC